MCGAARARSNNRAPRWVHQPLILKDFTAMAGAHLRNERHDVGRGAAGARGQQRDANGGRGLEAGKPFCAGRWGGKRGGARWERGWGARRGAGACGQVRPVRVHRQRLTVRARSPAPASPCTAAPGPAAAAAALSGTRRRNPSAAGRQQAGAARRVVVAAAMGATHSHARASCAARARGPRGARTCMVRPMPSIVAASAHVIHAAGIQLKRQGCARAATAPSTIQLRSADGRLMMRCARHGTRHMHVCRSAAHRGNRLVMVAAASARRASHCGTGSGAVPLLPAPSLLLARQLVLLPVLLHLLVALVLAQAQEQLPVGWGQRTCRHAEGWVVGGRLVAHAQDRMQARGPAWCKPSGARRRCRSSVDEGRRSASVPSMAG